jgi:hypothetical protein
MLAFTERPSLGIAWRGSSRRQPSGARDSTFRMMNLQRPVDQGWGWKPTPYPATMDRSRNLVLQGLILGRGINGYRKASVCYE